MMATALGAAQALRLRNYWPLWLLLFLAGLAVLGLFLISRLAGLSDPTPSTQTGADAETAEVLDWQRVLDRLFRYGIRPEGVFPEVEALLAAPTYYQAAGSEIPEEALAESSLIFYVSEDAHDQLPEDLPAPFLRVNGREAIRPVDTRVIATSPHHRMIMFRFRGEEVTGPSLNAGSIETLDLVFPGVGIVESADTVLSWELPIEFSDSYATFQVLVGPPLAGDSQAGESGVIAIPGRAVTLAAILAVLGGVIASMWPCLFQLTAFFIPALAGMTMEDARGEVPAAARLKVVKAAFFFVLGFTLVYTAAGAVIGFAAQRLGDSPNFMEWQRYLGIIGGTVILLLALRVAAKVRAPLVCKMPILSGMAQKKGTANPLEMMVAGLAFATGCMTCFGAALIIAMVVYVGASGSAAVGALVLFLFSLGMGIPLVIAAMAMAKALPMLFKLEKFVPWMGLASSLLMAGFAVLLITGNYMTLSNWFFRFIPDAALG